jgi:hypothetical protein
MPLTFSTAASTSVPAEFVQEVVEEEPEVEEPEEEPKREIVVRPSRPRVVRPDCPCSAHLLAMRTLIGALTCSLSDRHHAT